MDVRIAVAVTVLTAAACWTDIRRMRIPNGLTAGFAAGGFIYHASSEGWTGLLQAAAGGAAGFLPLLLLCKFGGMGAGDVKWFGAFGVWAGTAATVQLWVTSILLAGGFSVLLLLLRIRMVRRWGRRLPWPWGRHPAEPGKGAAFPFMLAVAPCLIAQLSGAGGIAI